MLLLMMLRRQLLLLLLLLHDYLGRDRVILEGWVRDYCCAHRRWSWTRPRGGCYILFDIIFGLFKSFLHISQFVIVVWRIERIKQLLFIIDRQLMVIAVRAIMIMMIIDCIGGISCLLLRICCISSIGVVFPRLWPIWLFELEWIFLASDKGAWRADQQFLFQKSFVIFVSWLLILLLQQALLLISIAYIVMIYSFGWGRGRSHSRFCNHTALLISLVSTVSGYFWFWNFVSRIELIGSGSRLSSIIIIIISTGFDCIGFIIISTARTMFRLLK